MRNRLWLLAVPLLLISACGEEQYSTDPGVTPQATGPVTGILINAQVPPDQVKLSTFDNWRVADIAGNVLFESSAVTAAPMGIPWEWKYAKATGWDGKAFLGGNFIEVKVSRNAVSEDQKSCDFYVDDASAAELRGLSNLGELVRRAKFIILVGHVGD